MQLLNSILSLLSLSNKLSALKINTISTTTNALTCPISALPPEHNITVGTVDRRFGLSNPALYQECEHLTSYPIILAFHGRGASWQHMAKLTNLHDPEHCAIAVYPQGLPGYGIAGNDTCSPTARLKPSWTGAPYTTCYDLDHPDQKRDDFGFFHAMLDYIESRPYLRADVGRVYVTGKSNGAHFTNYLACHPSTSKRIAAIAPVAGPYYQAKDIDTPDPECKPAHPIGVINFQGTEDQSVEYKGSMEWITCPSGASDSKGGIPRQCTGKIPSIWSWFLSWGRLNRCSAVREKHGGKSENQELIIQSFEECGDGKEVVHYKLVGGPHHWPAKCCNLDNRKTGGGCELAPVDATEEIVRFFRKFRVGPGAVSHQTIGRFDL